MPELKLKRGDIVRLEGQLSLEVKEGEVSVSGGLRGKGSKAVIPRAKSVPLEAESEALIQYTLGQAGKIEQLPERTIPKEWDALVSEIIQCKPRVMLVMGNVDVGKTFFTTYLSNKLLGQGLKVGAVDSDVGQADIGPPTTMGLGIFERPVALLYEVALADAYFVGSMSPSGHMLEFVVGMKWLVDRGLRKADVVIVNTPGWVSSGPARSLQLYTFELINPDMVVALQRERELEHLLASIPSSRIRRLPVSTKVRPRSHSERAALRAMLISKYFEGAGKLVLDLRRTRFERCYIGTGTPIDPQTLGLGTNAIYAEKIPEGLLLVLQRRPSDKGLHELESKFGHVKVIRQGDERNLIVGLVNEANELLGLGIVEKIDYERGHVVVLTPAKNADEISGVQIGSMKIKPTGEEVGTVRPGTF